MYAEIIAIGDELTSGQRLDTNTQWLSQRLAENGIAVLYHTTVGDDLAANVRVFREAIERADLILCTGGLGPTADDLTRQAIAETLGVDLVQDDPSLAHIEQLFSRRGRKMSERNRVQAMFPRGARAVPNPHGSAPGIDVDAARQGGGGGAARIIALPGVPAEKREMWEQTVAGIVREMSGGKAIRHYCLKCFGVGESDLEGMLPDMIRRGREPTVGITVSRATITLRVSARGETSEACYEAMQPTLQEMRQRLGKLVFGEQEDQLQDAVIRLLKERRKTLATFECGSGGLLAEWLSEADPDRQCYRGGMVWRDFENLPPQLANLSENAWENENHHLQKQQLQEAAEQLRPGFAADYALVLGAFPAVAAAGDAPPRVVYALAGPQETACEAPPFAGHPDILKHKTVKQALNLLRLKLLEAET